MHLSSACISERDWYEAQGTSSFPLHWVGRRTLQFFIPYRCTSSVTSVFPSVLVIALYVAAHFLVELTGGEGGTTFSYVPRFVLSNCAERTNPFSFTVVSCCSMSPVHFSRMTEQQGTAEWNVSFGYNAAGGSRVVRCSE
jgi:hypothetical protein